MKITYDLEADALYIQLREGVPAVDGVDIEDGVTADLDEDSHVIGFEVLDASKRLTADELSRVQYKNLVTEKAGEARLPA